MSMYWIKMMQKAPAANEPTKEAFRFEPEWWSKVTIAEFQQELQEANRLIMESEREMLRAFLAIKFGQREVRHHFETRLGSFSADLTIDTKREFWIVEAKVAPHYRDVGQLLAYEYAYKTEVHPAKDVRLVLVCSNIREDIVGLCEQEDIDVYYFAPLEEWQRATSEAKKELLERNYNGNNNS